MKGSLEENYVLIQQYAENAMGGACIQRGRFKENERKIMLMLKTRAEF